MQIKALCWMGVKTEKFEEVSHFFQAVMGLHPIQQTSDLVAFQLPSHDRIEVFGPHGPNPHFPLHGVVCGFLVADIKQATQELAQAGVELVGSLQGDAAGEYAWQHFRGPDGNLYELTQDPSLS